MSVCSSSASQQTVCMRCSVFWGVTQQRQVVSYLLVMSSRVKQSKNWLALRWDQQVADTLVPNYQSTLRKIPKTEDFTYAAAEA